MDSQRPPAAPGHGAHLEAPPAALRAFAEHRANARRRGIDFLFSLDEWWSWWREENRWARRGRGGQALVMARFGDEGPYAPENVYCATNTANALDMSHEQNSARAKKGWATKKKNGKKSHLKTRGDGHPRSRAVLTPLGRFGSAALAAEAHGLTRQAAAAKARAGRAGWSYAPARVR